MATLGYITAAQAAAYLGWPSLTTPQTTDLSLMIPIAEKLVNNYCGTSFVWEPNTSKSFSGDNKRILVPGYFISNLYRVDINDDAGNLVETIYNSTTPQNNDVNLMPDAPLYGAYRWLERPLISSIGSTATFTYNFANLTQSTFPIGSKNIIATADWGFETLPEPVVYAVALTVQMLFQVRSLNEFIRTESGAGRIVNQSFYADATQYLPSMARALLSEFINSKRFS